MCPTLTVGSFFRRVRSTFLFICSTTSNLNNFEPQQLESQNASKTKRRNKTDVQNLEITLRIPHSPTFFRHYATFFGTFWIAPKGPPFICFDILQHNGCQKIPKGPPSTFFGTVTLFKNLFKNFFGKFFQVPEGLPFNFFHNLQPAGVSQSPKGPPFTILSLRYSADFGRSRLV